MFCNCTNDEFSENLFIWLLIQRTQYRIQYTLTAQKKTPATTKPKPEVHFTQDLYQLCKLSEKTVQSDLGVRQICMAIV